MRFATGPGLTAAHSAAEEAGAYLFQKWMGRELNQGEGAISQAAKLLGALGGPGMLANKGVVGEVIRLLDAGATSETIAGLGLQLLGANTPTQIAQTLWTNVVGRAGTEGELKLLTDLMAGGVSAGELVVMAANLDANAVRIDLVGLAAKGIEFA